jgi:hypothetical protein
MIRAIQTIKSLKGNGDELDKKITERSKSTLVTDLSGEFSALFDIYTSYKNINTTVANNLAQIEAIRKQSTK